MQIQFVNHAGFIASTRGVSLLCDPWLVGRSFNEGWELLSPTPISDLDLAGVTHLWFSHEHPDHFSPASLKLIPEADRARISVLFQKTADRKVVRFCEKLGFAAVTEMAPRTWYPLGDGVELLCNPLATEWDADSWMCLRDGSRCLVNINDCGVSERAVAEDIRAQVGDVDVLFTQFSFAAWTGNPDDVALRRAEGKHILENIRLQTQVLKPRQVVPFASFIWFCHSESFYLNHDANRIEDVASFLRAEVDAEPVVLYPGDRWEVGSEHDTASALARYVADRARVLASGPSVHTEGVSEAELLEAGNSYVTRLREAVSPLLVRLDQAAEAARRDGTLSLISSLFVHPEPGLVYVRDLGHSYAFDLVRGLRPATVTEGQCHVSVSSDSLLFALRFLWGGETLQVNARFVENHAPGDDHLGATADPFFRQFRLARSLDLGRDMSWQNVFRKVQQRLARVFPPFGGGV